MKRLLLTPYFLLLIDAVHPALRLLPETETLNHVSVMFNVLFLHIIQKPAPLADQLQKPPPGMMVLHMGLEVLRQILDPGAQEGNLDFRGSGIRVVQLKVLDDSFSLFYI